MRKYGSYSKSLLLTFAFSNFVRENIGGVFTKNWAREVNIDKVGKVISSQQMRNTSHKGFTLINLTFL